MPRARLEIGALVAGIGVAVIGVLVLLDTRGAISLHFGVLGPVACGVAGATLLALGLTRRD
jgi:hypothetical protein